MATLQTFGMTGSPRSFPANRQSIVETLSVQVDVSPRQQGHARHRRIGPTTLAAPADFSGPAQEQDPKTSRKSPQFARGFGVLFLQRRGLPCHSAPQSRR
jgi:hypothetical protein